MRKNLLEESIIALLARGPIETKHLVGTLATQEGCTHQGVYKSLRSLRQKETILVHEKTVSLSLVWVDRELERLAEISRVYQSAGRATAYLSLRPDEQIRFRFHTLKELDLFWTHAFLIVQSHIKGDIPVYSLSPHDWFDYARPETNRAWADAAMKIRRPQNVVATHTAQLDKLVYQKRKRGGADVEVHHANPFNQNERVYYNIIDDWLFEAKLDASVTTKLGDWIAKQKTLPEKNTPSISKILVIPGKFELKVSRVTTKVNRIKRRVEKYFTR